jgi:hypothetical protein
LPFGPGKMKLQSWPKVRRTTKQICNFLIYLGF